MDSCHPTEGVQLARQHCRTKSARNEIEMVGAGDGISRAIPEIRTQRSSAWVLVGRNQRIEGRGNWSAVDGDEARPTTETLVPASSPPLARPQRALLFLCSLCLVTEQRECWAKMCFLGWAALQHSAFYFFSLSHPPSITEFIDLGQGLFAISQ
jgi:hypothetical protein